MEISDTALFNVRQAITRWGDRLSDSTRNGLEIERRMYGNWLFGAEAVLGLLGLSDLMQAAVDAQANADPLKEDAK